MKRRNYKGREPLPLAVSDAAQTGDADAVEQVFLLLNSLSNLFDKLTVAPLRKSEEIHCSGRGHAKP